MNLLGNILHRAKNSLKLNILCAPTHETYNSALAQTGHNFYCLYRQEWKIWDETFRKCPNNYILLKDGNIPTEIDFDCVLSEQKVGQFQYFYPLSKRYQLPLVSIEHTAPPPWYKKAHLMHNKSMRGDINVFITDWSREQWGWDKQECEVIYHGIDSEIFKPDNSIKQPYILTVVNQFSKPERHWCCGFNEWAKIIKPNTKESLPWKHIGKDEGFSKPAKNLEDLIKEYNTCSIFLNTSLVSPIPMSLLEAAACSCAIVSTNTSDIPNIFKHGETALLSNNIEELRLFCIELLRNNALREKLGANAREMVKQRFNLTRFKDDWNRIFNIVRNIW